MNDEDEHLATRIRTLLSQRPGYSEQKMFGGIAFMIHGNMCVGPWKGSLIVRLAREDHDKTQTLPHVQPMDITGKIMRGWARIEPEGIQWDEDLRTWVDRAYAYVQTMTRKE